MWGLSVLFSIFLFSGSATAVTPDQKKLPQGFAPEEIGVLWDREAASAPPAGEIHSLGEWEEPEAAMTLWPNASLVGALAAHGPVRLFADTSSEVTWWRGWLNDNHISQTGIGYFVIPTDTVWIRDYGPWYIIDGGGSFGLVDNIYNRPRPQDDKVPEKLSQQLGIPNYKTGLTHTGGNYYSDGLGSAFSSTLVFSENQSLSASDVLARMFQFLGVGRYATSELGKNITIEHMDTFGKLVAPDTWVFSQFAQNSRFYRDSERMVSLLQTMKSPYGTPYRIYRIPMYSAEGSERYRAYINSFISGGALYFPTYGGDAVDTNARRIYQEALPGYDIVGVQNLNTEWGDSVHCRTRNLLNKNTIFIFPKVVGDIAANRPIVVKARVLASPQATLSGVLLSWHAGRISGVAKMELGRDDIQWTAEIPAQASGTKIAFSIEARDSKGVVKTHPIKAPSMLVRFTVP